MSFIAEPGRAIGVRTPLPRDLVHPVPIDPAGVSGPTAYQARTTKWRRTSRGLYVPACVDSSMVEQRIVEQAARLSAYGAVTAWAALRLHGAAYFDGTGPDGRPLPVPLIVSSHLQKDCRIALTQCQLDPRERTERCGVVVTIAERAVLDEVRRGISFRAGVAAVDMAYAAGLTDPERLRTYVEACGPWTGIPRMRDVVALARVGSESPQESRMRLIWTLDAGLPMPLLNPRLVDDRGSYLGKPDLLDVESGLVGEYDGEHHRDREQHRRDIDREARFRGAGLEYVTMVAGDPPDVIVHRIRAARGRARWAGPGSRRWQVVGHLSG